MCGMDSTILMIHHFNYRKQIKNKSSTKKVTFPEEPSLLYTQNMYKEKLDNCRNNKQSKVHEH